MQERSRIDRARWSTTALMILLAGSARLALGQQPAPPPQLRPLPPASQEVTLERAVERAFAAHPELRAAEARLREAGGQRLDAETFPHNPVFEVEAASRDGADQNSTDFELSLGQEIEIAGQRGNRIDITRAELSAQRAGLMHAKRILAGRVHLAFVTALEAREILEVARRDMQLAEGLYDLAQRRLDRGAGTQLDVNVAAAERGRAEGRFQTADADYTVARAELAEAMGLDVTFSPLPQGNLEAKLHALPPVEELVESARETRADLQQLRQLETASRVRHALARSEAWPNLTVRVFGGQEEGTDRIIGGGLSIPIPFFHRNQGRAEETLASIDRAHAERLAAEISVGRQVVAAHARFQAGLHTAQKLRRLVLGTLEENLGLLQRSFEAGKATWPEVIVIRRTLVDAQRELTVAQAETLRAWTELQLAAGRMPLPEQKEER
jgi:cobalt-zinc-cadmium efflux system outer membrane protein